MTDYIDDFPEISFDLISFVITKVFHNKEEESVQYQKFLLLRFKKYYLYNELNIHNILAKNLLGLVIFC